MPDFESFLLKQFQHVDKTNSDEREKVYSRARDVLNQTLTGANDRQLLLDSQYELEDVISRIEGTFPKKKRKRRLQFWYVIDRMNQIWSVTEKLGKAALLVSAAVTIAGAAYWFFWSDERELPSVQRTALEQTACKPLSKDQCDVLIAVIERTKNRGVIVAANAGNPGPALELSRQNAEKVLKDPASSASAKQLAAADVSVLNQALNRIEEQTRRTADGVERLNKGVDAVKRETSDDPRKELQNLGKKWTEEDFKQTMVMCDIRALKLYRDAGMKLRRNLALDRLVYVDLDCLQVYREQFVAFGPELCFSPEFTIVGTVNPIAYLKTAFKAPERRRFVEGLCGETRLRESYPELYGGAPKNVSLPEKAR